MAIKSGAQRLADELANQKRSNAHQRLGRLFDEGSFDELDAFVKTEGHQSEVVTGYGTINGTPAYAFAQDKSICGGAMGLTQAAKIKKVYSLAAKTGLPVVGIYDSDGAYLLEGVDAMEAYGTLMNEVNRLSGVVPQISLVLGSCTGCAAMLAASADILIVEKDAALYLTAPTLVGGSKSGSGTAQAVCENGTAQLLAEGEDEALEQARTLVSMLPLNNLSPVPAAQASDPLADGCLFSAVVDGNSTVELSSAFGKAVKTSFARVMGVTCGFVNMVTEETDGRLDTDSCVKAARFVRLCDSFAIPVVTIVDAAGFEATLNAELGSGVRDAAMVAHAYAEATTVKISLVAGKAYGPVYTAFAGKGCSADLVLAFADAQISALAPEAAVSLLWNDRLAAGEKREQLVQEYELGPASVFEAAAKGYVDDVIEPSELRSKLYLALEMLSGKRETGLAKKHSNMPL